MTDTVSSESTNSTALPDNWIRTTLGEICARVEKVNPKDKPEQRFTYLDIAAIDNSAQRIVQPKTYSGADAPSRARQLVQAGDVLFSTVRTYLKNIAQVPQQYDSQVASTGLTVIRSPSGVADQFLFHVVQTSEFLEPLNAKQRGTSYPAVRDSDVFAQPVALPPFNEQRRIVEKIEEHFTKLDAGVRLLKQTQALLKSYRRSVLKAAVEGELSREWREAHRDELEPASELLDRILQERREKFTGKKYKEPASPDTSALPELPNGWEWARLDSLASIKGGITKDSKRKYEESRTVPYLRVANVQRGYLDLSELKEIEASDDVIEQLLLEQGDVLFTEGGDRDKLGRGWIWDGQVAECIHQNHVFRARSYSAHIEPKFVS